MEKTENGYEVGFDSGKEKRILDIEKAYIQIIADYIKIH